MENKIFIKNIKYLREYLKLTQTEFGEKLGKRYNTIQNWERGRSIPDKTTKEHIKNTLNINLDWLFYDKGSMFLDKNKENNKYQWLIDTLDKLSEEDIKQVELLAQKIFKEKYNKETIKNPSKKIG